jgi:NADH dehydrogenase (ubiquinone) Fe-S protein 5
LVEWQQFVECYSAKRTTDTKACKPMAEDYQECLHHQKEQARQLKINEQLSRNKSENPDYEIGRHQKFDVSQLGLVKDEN